MELFLQKKSIVENHTQSTQNQHLQNFKIEVVKKIYSKLYIFYI